MYIKLKTKSFLNGFQAFPTGVMGRAQGQALAMGMGMAMAMAMAISLGHVHGDPGPLRMCGGRMCVTVLLEGQSTVQIFF